MNLSNFENTIISVLKEIFPQFTVESFPSNFSDYTFTSPVGCHLVRYNGSDFSAQNTVWGVTQPMTVKYSVITGYRGLQNYNEIHPQQEVLRNTLKGHKFFGKKIFLSSEEFLTEINGDLYMGLNFSVKIFETENEEYDEIFV